VKIYLRPLYSQLNAGVGSCPLGCQQVCQVYQSNPTLTPLPGCTCPLSSHQAQTYAQIVAGDTEIIFNQGATGDGKSLAAQLPGLLNPKFQTVALYPTIELITDQEDQIKDYYEKFITANPEKVDSLYGAELAKRTEAAGKGGKFRELLRSLKQTHLLLTNPDIFHLVTHYQYYNPATEQGWLPLSMAQNPDLYVFDEFHIFGVHQEAAILNSLILIRNARQKKYPLRCLFTSATPKPSFISQLQQVGFNVALISGAYTSEPRNQYRQISQPVELEFIELKDTDSLGWLTEQAQAIQAILQAENRGRGLIILNSVALVSQVVRQLQKLLAPDVIVEEISGRIDRYEREATRKKLAADPKPVLVVATSAVDVGVDFKIHLLIFESSDSATFIQRLGRLGRHPGFKHYKAFALIPDWMRWILPQLRQKLQPGQEVDRTNFREEIIEYVFDAPQEYQQYRQYWGGLQAQGMLITMSGANTENKRERAERLAVTKSLSDRILQDLHKIYGGQLEKKRGYWFALGNDSTGKAIQNELLRFRGGSDLQAAVWDNSRFYTYGLLRLLPHTEIEVIDRHKFLEAATKAHYSAVEFPEKYIQVYLKIKAWSDQRNDNIYLDCDLGTDELRLCTLTIINEISIEGHPQSKQLRGFKNLLTFLVPLSRQHPTLWDVRNKLRLSPTFGLYQLTDADDESYACAFNQDALLLEALKWKLKRCEKTKPYIF
jgi:CRISPR-associated endonuclease/helicase Cas3